MNTDSKLSDLIQADMHRRRFVSTDASLALQLVMAQLDRAHASGDARLVVQSLQDAAALCEASLDWPFCYRLTLEAEIICMENELSPELARVNIMLGRCLAAVEDFDRALPRLTTAHKMARILGHREGEMEALSIMADCYLSQQQYIQVSDCLGEFAQVMPHSRPSERTNEFVMAMVRTQVHLAASLLADDQAHEASEQCELALQLQFRIWSAPRYALSSTDIQGFNASAKAYLLQGKKHLSAQSALTLLKSGRRRNDSVMRATACDRVADILMAQGKLLNAIRWLIRSYVLWEERGQSDEQVAALTLLSDALTKLGHEDNALRYLQQAQAITLSSKNEHASMRAKFNAIEKNAELARHIEPEALAHTSRLAGLGSMVASISHEVTQPLSAIRLLAESALDGGEPSSHVTDSTQRAEQAFNRILQLVDHLSVYVQHLKRFARCERAEITTVPMSSIIKEALAIVEPKHKASGVKLALDLDDVCVLGDHGRTVAILVNLLCNALDAASGVATPQICLKVRKVDNRVLILIRDHGAGLSVQALAHLFQPYYTTKGSGKGLGLGLALSMDIAKQMNARLEGANHPEGGAVFTLNMPFVQAPRSAVDTESTSRQADPSDLSEVTTS